MKKLFKIFWFPVLLFLANETSFATQMYITYPNSDRIMHALGGAAIAYMLITYHREFPSDWWKRIPLVWKFLFIVAFAVLFGVAWEWYEYVHDQMFGTHYQPSNENTMFDLLFDFIGSIVLSIIALLPSKRT